MMIGVLKKLVKLNKIKVTNRGRYTGKLPLLTKRSNLRERGIGDTWGTYHCLQNGIT